MILYHGTDNHLNFNNVTFFSTCENFASDYGEVKEYKVKLGNVFDTLNNEHVNLLLNYTGEIVDLYDNRVFKTFSEYQSSSNFALDTWEIFEQYIDVIKSIGFDSIRIFEGGIENFATFNKTFEVLQ